MDNTRTWTDQDILSAVMNHDEGCAEGKDRFLNSIGIETTTMVYMVVRVKCGILGEDGDIMGAAYITEKVQDFIDDSFADKLGQDINADAYAYTTTEEVWEAVKLDRAITIGRPA